MSGPREVPRSSLNPEAQSHEALKAMTDAANPGAAQVVADGWSDLASGFDEAADLFHRARTSSEPGWSGDAAEAMRAALARVADWTRVTAANYKAAATTITTQAEAAQSAKTAMPPPVRYDPAAMIRTAIGNPADLAALPFRLHEQKQRHDAAHAEAARVVTMRDHTLTEAASALPAFTKPPTLTTVTTAPASPAPASPAPRPASPAPRPASSAPRPASSASGHASGPPRTEAAAANRPAAPGPAVMPANAGPGSPPQPAPPSQVRAPSPTAPVHPGGPGPNRPGSFAPNQANGPARAPNPPLPPNQNGPAQTRPAGFNQPRPPGPPGRPAPWFPATGPSNAAPGPFAAAGFAAAPAATASPVTATPPAADFGPSGFGPGGSGPAPVNATVARVADQAANAEAKAPEKKRPQYLVEPETAGMFGSDQLTSPPVIGEE